MSVGTFSWSVIDMGRSSSRWPVPAVGKGSRFWKKEGHGRKLINKVPPLPLFQSLSQTSATEFLPLLPSVMDCDQDVCTPRELCHPSWFSLVCYHSNRGTNSSNGYVGVELSPVNVFTNATIECPKTPLASTVSLLKEFSGEPLLFWAGKFFVNTPFRKIKHECYLFYWGQH